MVRAISALGFLAVSLLLLPAPARAEKPMGLDARLANPVMKAGEQQKNYLRIALNGCEPKRSENRNPVNVAFVIDRSGSMAGERIAQAREAAILAVRRLDPNDIASVVIFDNQVDVLAPAQPVTNHDYYVDLIRRARGPDPDLQPRVRRRAGRLRADRLDRRRPRARCTGRALAQPRRQGRRQSRSVHDEPGLRSDRALRAARGRVRRQDRGRRAEP